MRDAVTPASACAEGSLSPLDARRMAAATERVRVVFAPFDHVLSPALPIHAFPAEQPARGFRARR